MYFIQISFLIALAIVATVVQANDALLKGINASNGTDATGMKAGFIEGKGLDLPAVCPHQATCSVIIWQVAAKVECRLLTYALEDLILNAGKYNIVFIYTSD